VIHRLQVYLPHGIFYIPKSTNQLGAQRMDNVQYPLDGLCTLR